MSKTLLIIENRTVEDIPNSMKKQTVTMKLEVTKFAGPAGVENVDPDMCVQFTTLERQATKEGQVASFQVRSYYQLQKLVSVLTDVLTSQVGGYFAPLVINQDEMENTLVFKQSDRKPPLMIGDRRKFIEYAVILQDMDNNTRLPGTCMFLDDYPKVEERACEVVKESLSHAFGGNTVKAHFIGPTGRTCWGILQIQKKGWKVKEEITPATLNLDQFVNIE